MPNLFAPRPRQNQEEFLTLLQTPGLNVEQIISHGQASDFWYDQAQAEWVVLLQGTATLEIQDQGVVELGAGDYLNIPAHQRHRVVFTSEDAVWLAIHYNDPDCSEMPQPGIG